MDRLLKYKKFLGFFRVPDGWRDVGKIPASWEDGDRCTYVHPFCGDTRIRHGITDKATTFSYCPKCRVVIDPLPEGD